MNILPKKSWHVRNKDNVARVRRDEAQAQAEEDARASRRALAEKEARTSLLRSKAHQKTLTGTVPDEGDAIDNGKHLNVVTADGQPKHINFFAELEAGVHHGSNKEYEAEKKAEQEKQEKRIGLLTYLGQSVTESSKPWYFQPRKKEAEETDNKCSKDESRKNRLDPLNTVKKYLDVKSKHNSHHRKDKHGVEKHKDKETLKHRKHKHKHKKKKIKEEREKEKNAKLEALREQRIKRELQERSREVNLVKQIRGETTVKEETSISHERSRRYNSQYNPDLARRPKEHRYQPY